MNTEVKIRGVDLLLTHEMAKPGPQLHLRLNEGIPVAVKSNQQYLFHFVCQLTKAS